MEKEKIIKREWLVAAAFMAAVLLDSFLHSWMGEQGSYTDFLFDIALFGLVGVGIFIVLRRSEIKRQKYETLLHASESIAGTGAWSYDIRRKAFHASQGLWRLIEKTPEPGHTIEECLALVVPEDRERLGKHIREALHGRKGWTIEYTIVTPKGQRKRVESRGKVLTIGGRPFLVATIFDITAAAERQRRVHFFNALVNNAYESVLLTDTDRRIFYVNDAFCKMTGYSRKEALGKTPHELKASGHHDAEFYKTVWENIDRTHRWEGELLNRKKSAEVYVERIVISAVYHHDELLGYGAVGSEVAGRGDALEHYLHIGEYDPLTGLYGRFAFLEQLQARLTQTDAGVVMLLNINDFKKANEGLGLLQGDRVLQQIARRLESVQDDVALIGHIGGDEFVLFSADDDAEQIAHNAETILQRVGEPYDIDGLKLFLNASIGIACFPKDGGNGVTLLHHANVAMRRAKREQHSRFFFYDSGTTRYSKAALLLEHRMHEALERGEFFVLYQPKVALTSGTIVGFEALARWKNDQGETVSPGAFIPVAEKSGMIVELSEALYAQAFAWVDALVKQVPGRSVQVALNLSGGQLLQPKRLLRKMKELFERHPGACGHIELELVESMLLDQKVLLETMDALKAYGVTFAIDDFGTGYSSLSYLKKFPVDKIKIDQSFIRNVTTDDADRRIVTAIIQMSKSLGYRTIAEGTETRQQIDFIQALGCDIAQGFYFSKPVDATTAALLLEQQPFEGDDLLAQGAGI